MAWVEEADTIRACHRLARRGFLFGGSTGTAVSGAMDWLAEHNARDLTAVAIAPGLVLQRHLADVGPATCGNATTIQGANLPDQDCDQQLRSWLGAGAVAVLGERYLDTIYQTNWFQDLYGEDVLSSGELPASSRPV